MRRCERLRPRKHLECRPTAHPALRRRDRSGRPPPVRCADPAGRPYEVQPAHRRSDAGAAHTPPRVHAACRARVHGGSLLPLRVGRSRLILYPPPDFACRPHRRHHPETPGDQHRPVGHHPRPRRLGSTTERDVTAPKSACASSSSPKRPVTSRRRGSESRTTRSPRRRPTTSSANGHLRLPLQLRRRIGQGRHLKPAVPAHRRQHLAVHPGLELGLRPDRPVFDPGRRRHRPPGGTVSTQTCWSPQGTDYSVPLLVRVFRTTSKASPFPGISNAVREPLDTHRSPPTLSTASRVASSTAAMFSSRPANSRRLRAS